MNSLGVIATPSIHTERLYINMAVVAVWDSFVMGSKESNGSHSRLAQVKAIVATFCTITYAPKVKLMDPRYTHLYG